MAAHFEDRGRKFDTLLRFLIWGAGLGLILLPRVAMQFTSEVDWDRTDFLVMGGMLFAACATAEAVLRVSRNAWYRAGAGTAIAGAFLLVWINLAVGIIGSEVDPANLLFAGVLVVGGVGAVAGRFTATAMARALTAMAAAHALVAVIVAVAGWGVEALVLSVCFALGWLVSAGLFRKAARTS